LPGNREIIEAFIKEAEADLRSAWLLLTGKEYSQTVVHCQHAVEKILKSALAFGNIIITKQHVVSPDFVVAFPDLAEANQIAMVASLLEKEGTRTEYPSLGGRTYRSGFLPDNTKKVTPGMLLRRQGMCQTVMAFLKEKYGL